MHTFFLASHEIEQTLEVLSILGLLAAVAYAATVVVLQIRGGRR